MNLGIQNQALFRRTIALPQDHGSWVFLLSPLLIGIFAGGQFSLATGFLILAALAAFLIRQPVTMAVKATSGRRSRRDLPAALFWIAIYALLALVGVVGLALQGYGYLVVLAIPAVPVFAWHLWLVSRRSERRQIGVELIATGVLALAAPAAMWVGLGRPVPSGWLLFFLVWFQSAASIVFAYLRLEQRVLPAEPNLLERLRMGRRALMYTTFNLAAVLLLAAGGLVPLALSLAYALQWLESIYGTLRPAVGYKPTAIGVRQLIVSSLFTLLFILTWNG